MLTDLLIKNMAVIDEVRLKFQSGFQVLTGETGAGKSILVEAIGLILGNKADASLIRDGASEALVEACFDAITDSTLLTLLEEEGLQNGDDPNELIIRREINAAGKNKIYINQKRVTLALLQKTASCLIDFTGQHEQMQLLDTQNDILVLDSFLPDKKLIQNYRAIYENALALDTEKQRLARLDAQKAERLEWLGFQLADFEKLSVQSSHEEEQLKRERELRRHQSTISQYADLAANAITDGDENCLDRLNKLIQTSSKNPVLEQMFSSVVKDLEEIKIRLEDAAYEIARVSSSVDGSNGLNLDEIESRLFQAEKLKRRFGPEIENVIAKRDELLAEKFQLQNADELLHKAQEDFLIEFAKLKDAGQQLSRARVKVRNTLEKRVMKELADLQMPGVRFEVAITSLVSDQLDDFSKYSKSGIDDVQFLLSPNQGLSPRPLAKIASGGETSRIFLALKQVLAGSSRRSTFIFDEIDTGISGAAVELVGNKLKSLAGDSQVFCVTHHAQIASQADQHYFVQKNTEKNRTITRVKTLNQQERIQEIARLMGGVEITKKNLEYAAELVKGK